LSWHIVEETPLLRVGIIAMLVVHLAVAAKAQDETDPCLRMRADQDSAYELSGPGRQPRPTDNQCEAVEKRELRMPLFEIPQDEENPMG
jgi:hypothetical protein